MIQVSSKHICLSFFQPSCGAAKDGHGAALRGPLTPVSSERSCLLGHTYQVSSLHLPLPERVLCTAARPSGIASAPGREGSELAGTKDHGRPKNCPFRKVTLTDTENKLYSPGFRCVCSPSLMPPRETFRMHLHAAASLGSVIYHVSPKYIITMIICI